MFSKLSAGPSTVKQTPLIHWTLFALIFAALASQCVGALPTTMERHVLGRHYMVKSHMFSARGDGKDNKSANGSPGHKSSDSNKKNGAFQGLGAFSNVPVLPHWGLETGKELKNKKQGTKSSSKSDRHGPTGNESESQSRNANLHGGAAIDLEKVLGHDVGDVVKVKGGIDIEYTSGSKKYHTRMPTGVSSSNAPKSTQSHHKPLRHGHAQKHKGSSSSKPAASSSYEQSGVPDLSNKATTHSGLRTNGFYRIGITEGSKPLLLQDEESIGDQLAGLATAQEPGGNLPNQSVITNNPEYGFLEAQEDLFTIREWADDLDQLVGKQHRNETIMALFDAASRYYPDVDTKVVVRIMLADIKAESDFQADNNSPGRLDSGSSVGLVQVSPAGASNELSQFQKAVMVDKNTYSWSVGRGSDDEVEIGGHSVLGPLLDFKTGEKMDLSSLKDEDVLRPWVNIHVAMWLQSNHARTGSQDPWRWPDISSASKEVRSAYQPAIREILGTSSSTSASSNSSASSSASSGANSGVNRRSNSDSSSFSESLYASTLDSLNSKLDGKNGQRRSFATALGSWVAGPSDDPGGYKTSGDDISAQYFKNIAEGLSVLYTGSPEHKDVYGKTWLDGILLTPGLIDYAK